MPVIVETASWVTKKVQLSAKDVLRIRMLMKDKSCRYEADALRLAINEGLKVLGF